VIRTEAATEIPLLDSTVYSFHLGFLVMTHSCLCCLRFTCGTPVRGTHFEVGDTRALGQASHADGFWLMGAPASAPLAL
jgi:hypothetical protein